MAEIDMVAVGGESRWPGLGLGAHQDEPRFRRRDWFMLPAAGFLFLFLAYPLVLGIWMSFTDARIGRRGNFIGLENYAWLVEDDSFINATVFTIAYTGDREHFKFAIGLYLAILLNKKIPFRSLVRSMILIPFIVPTVLSAIAFWWIFDPQFSIVSWSLRKLGLISTNVDFLGVPLHAPGGGSSPSTSGAAFPSSRSPFSAGLQTVPMSLTKPRPSTAPVPGRCSGPSPIRFSLRSSRS